MQVVKVQVPLAGGQRGRGLVHAQGRRQMMEQPLPAAVMLAMNGDAVGYFEASYDRTEGWQIGKRVPDPGWPDGPAVTAARPEG